jgi:four helix bundle protein
MSPVRHYSQLTVWKLADQLRREVFRLTGRQPFARDFKAQGQTDDAINSVCRNIAEGFSGTHAEFANFLCFSRRSLNELRDAIHAARLKDYVSVEELQHVMNLANRLTPALSRFIAYLRRTPDPERPHRRPKSRTDKHQPNRTDPRQRDRTDKDRDRTNKDRCRTDKNRARTDKDPDRTDKR